MAYCRVLHYYFIWNGTGTWDKTVYWSTGVVPESTDIAFVESGTLTLNQDAEVAGMVIEAGAVLQIAPNQTLTVSDTLTNKAGNSGLVLESDATGTGMLMNNSTGIQATVEQYLVKDQWHYMGIPVSYVSNVDDVSHGCYVAWIDESNASSASTSGWEYLSEGDSLIALHGYAMQHNKAMILQ